MGASEQTESVPRGRRAWAAHALHDTANTWCADNGIGAGGARSVCDGVRRLTALTSLALDLQRTCVRAEEEARRHGRRAATAGLCCTGVRCTHPDAHALRVVCVSDCEDTCLKGSD